MPEDKRFPIYNRLAFKIVCGVTAVLLVVGAAFSYRIAKFHEGQMINTLQESASSLSMMVVTSLEHAMLTRDLHLLMEMVQNLKEEEGVERILILNRRGKIKVSPDPQLIGKVIDRENPSCVACHKYSPDKRSRTIIFKEKDGEEVFRSVTPIMNKPKCRGCHDSKDKINGVLIMDFSTVRARGLLASNLNFMFMLIASMIAGMILAVSVLLTRLMTRRIKNLEKIAQIIGGGDLDQVIEEKGRDEIGSLAHHFNHMTKTLKDHINDSTMQREYLEDIINSVDDGVMVVDNDFKVVLANKACESLFGYSPEEVQGNSCYVVSHGRSTPCNDPMSPCPVSQTFSTGRYFKVIHSYCHGSGQERHIEIHSSPLRDKEGHVYQVIEVLRDITARKQLEAQLIHSERLTSLGVLASGLSHEISNPLASVATFIEGLKNRIDQNNGLEKVEELSGFLNLAVNELKKCKDIIGRLLLLSRKSDFKRDFVDVNRSLEETISLIAHEAAARDIEIYKQLSDGLPMIQGDETQLRQLFLNMTLNALQAMEEGGGTLTVTSEAEDSRVSIVFKDTGAGIKREDLSKIFDPFFTTKAKGKGTGLGLSICHNIVRQHQGQISVESVEAEGSKFVITLPAALNLLKSVDQ